MALCGQCGSIRIVRAESDQLDRLVAVFTAKRPFLCRRCGWRARRTWTNSDLQRLENYGAGGAEVDPSLIALDAPTNRRRRTKLAKSAVQDPDAFALESLDLNSSSPDNQTRLELPHSQSSGARQRRSRNRRLRSRRGEILATVFVTVVITLAVMILTLTGSCAGGEAL
jgi:hypothetical protein